MSEVRQQLVDSGAIIVEALSSVSNARLLTDAQKDKVADLPDSFFDGSWSSLQDVPAVLSNTTAAFTTEQASKLDGVPSSFDKSTVGLDQVDNTSDDDKPVSVAQQEALDQKVSSDGITSISSLTQAEFEAIETPSATTLYVITDA